MLTLNKSPLICYDFFELENKNFLIKTIREKASKDQTKTSIRLDTAYCNIYQPKKFGSDDFETCRQVFSDKLSKMVSAKYRVMDDLWGLDYENGEGTSMHDHKSELYRFSAIYYLAADDGCGTLVFKDPYMEIEPKENMFVVFDCHLVHGVLPAVNEEAKRTCIAMNARFTHEPIRLS